LRRQGAPHDHGPEANCPHQAQNGGSELKHGLPLSRVLSNPRSRLDRSRGPLSGAGRHAPVRERRSENPLSLDPGVPPWRGAFAMLRWPLAAAFMSSGLKPTARRSMASCAAEDEGKELAVSAHTTSQATRRPSSRHARSSFGGALPELGIGSEDVKQNVGVHCCDH
jgi:hypothetical protein